MLKLFVYGTLMTGYRNYEKYLEGHVVSCKRAYILGGKLYHLVEKDCPAIVEGYSRVYGQVLEINDDENNTILNAVDALEKHFQGSSEIMYERIDKNVYYEDGGFEELGVYIFVNENYLNNHEIIAVESGDWNEFVNLNEANS